MKRELDLTLRGICKGWAYGPHMDAYADGDDSAADRPEFWAEAQELLEVFGCSWRRTTLRIAQALVEHSRSQGPGIFSGVRCIDYPDLP